MHLMEFLHMHLQDMDNILAIFGNPVVRIASGRE